MSSEKPKCPTTEKLIKMILVDTVNRDIDGIDNIYKNWKKEKASVSIKKVYQEKNEAIQKAKEVKKEAIRKAKEGEKEAIRKAKESEKEAIKKAKAAKNGEEKIVKLSKYNIFVREYQKRIMEMYPGIENRERMGKIGIEWRKHNAIIANLNDKYVEEITWVPKVLFC
jgi:flagellar biosynthesis/type III secretory pathway protein FliH